jgi:hypothetical protein
MKYIKLFEEFTSDLILEKKEAEGTIEVKGEVPNKVAEDLKKAWASYQKISKFKIANFGRGQKTVYLYFQKDNLEELTSFIKEIISNGSHVFLNKMKNGSFESFFGYDLNGISISRIPVQPDEAELVNYANQNRIQKAEDRKKLLDVRAAAKQAALDALKDGKSIKDAQAIMLKTAKSSGIDFLITLDGETEEDFVSRVPIWAPDDYVDISVVFDEVKQEMKKFGANLVSEDKDILSFDGEVPKGYYQIEVIYADEVLYINNGATQEEVYTINNKGINAKNIMSNIKKGISSKKLLSK